MEHKSILAVVVKLHERHVMVIKFEQALANHDFIALSNYGEMIFCYNFLQKTGNI